jgi:hypothetical protein
VVVDDFDIVQQQHLGSDRCVHGIHAPRYFFV